jgi:hypothetical protein
LQSSKGKNPQNTPSNAFACSPLVRVVMLNAMAVSSVLAMARYCSQSFAQTEKKKIFLLQQSHMPPLLPSPSTAISTRIVIASFRIQARDVEEVWVGHLTLAACAGAEVEIESRPAGRAGAVSASCVVGVASFG